MTTSGSAPHQEDAKSKDFTRYLDWLVPAASETLYDRLVGYGFARRYVRGKAVAAIAWEDVGQGSRVLAATADSVTGMANSAEAVEAAEAAYSAPNVSYQRVYLPELPFPDEHFDVVAAFGVVENLREPEDLIRETKRILKRDGVLIVSVPDKLVHASGHAGEGTLRRQG